MPRLENTGDSVSAYCTESGDGSATFDLCHRCAEVFRGMFINEVPNCVVYSGEPDGYLDGDVNHPSYDDDEYSCVVCEQKLTEKRDG